MAPTRPASKPRATLENPLDYLPCSPIAQYGKRQVIYNQNEPSASIYLILEGKVKVSRLAEGGCQVLVNIYQTDEFFGESALLHLSRRPESAAALENSKLMTWPVSVMEELVMRQPRLGIAFAQVLARRTTEFAQRIESFSADNVARRLARCLIRLSERMGDPEDEGSVRMLPFTHELLSEDIGTTREIVTHYMNQFRNQGYLQYSRKGIVVYRNSLDEWLRQASRESADVPALGRPWQSSREERQG
jgi:CRP-like cAMP-binding protein